MRFALITDSHIGGKFREDMYNKGVKIACNVNADYLLHLGDLTGDGTLADYQVSKQYLEKINFDGPFLIIPGNHDARNVGYLLWEEMIGKRFFVHSDEKKKVKILALDSSLPDLDAGRISPKGIKRIYEEFEDLPEYWLKVIMFHHHTLPVPYTGRERSAIYDAGDTVRALLDNNIHLVFNGHRHFSNTYRMSDGAMRCWVINGGTISCKKTRYREEYSVTIVDVEPVKNDINIRVLELNHDPIREKITYSGHFQELSPPTKKEKIGTIAHIGNTNFSKDHFNEDAYQAGINIINKMDCDVVVHSGSVTSSSYYDDFEIAKAFLNLIEKPLLIVPGVCDATSLGYELFPEMIGDTNPFFENEKIKVQGFNSCMIDDVLGRLGRSNNQIIKEKLGNLQKIGVAAFHHTVIPLPRIKHDSELMDAGDILYNAIENRINLVLTGAKNLAGCWQVNDTIFANTGTISSQNVRSKRKNSFNVIDIYQTNIGKYYEIYEYLIENGEKKNIGLFHISDIARPLRVPEKIDYNAIIEKIEIT